MLQNLVLFHSRVLISFRVVSDFLEQKKGDIYSPARQIKTIVIQFIYLLFYLHVRLPYAKVSVYYNRKII